MYHDIGVPANAYETVAPVQLGVQMEWLYAEGYRAISLAELGALSLRDAGRVVLITADDGHASFMDFAFPLLREYGFHATVNIVGRYVGGFVNENHPRLSWDECRYLMRSKLVDIGCHTFDLHDGNLLASRADALAEFNRKLAQDLVVFQNVYERELGKSADILAWPYGFYDSDSLAIARRAGFNYLLNSEGRPIMNEHDRHDVPRVAVNNTMNLAGFRTLFGDKR
jgi:peptidoglycan/xylan/chitin deacetylase (PgdA/CDA1 family)